MAWYIFMIGSVMVFLVTRTICNRPRRFVVHYAIYFEAYRGGKPTIRVFAAIRAKNDFQKRLIFIGEWEDDLGAEELQPDQEIWYYPVSQRIRKVT